MSSTRGWLAQGAGRAASSNSVTATSDKVVTISVHLLSFFLERLKNEGGVEEPGWLLGELALMALPLLLSKGLQKDLAGPGDW